MNQLKTKQRIILIIGIIIISIFIIYYVYTKDGNNFEIIEENVLIPEEEKILEDEGNVNEDETIKEVEEKNIMVHITGAVKNEGVVYLDSGSRVINAIEEAGGATQEADLSKINLVFPLEDGMKIYIPSIYDDENIENEIEEDEYITKSSDEIISEQSSKEAESKVNINKATQTELETLPGIGPSTALKIIEYRENEGKFKKIEDIKEVSGIGEVKFEKIKDFIEI